jgi:hypothetical protein
MKMDFTGRVFSISNDQDFNELALELFRYQYHENKTYRSFADALGTDPLKIIHVHEIPFLPILFYKTHPILCGNKTVQKTFLSSGTTGTERSRHPVSDLNIYRKSLIRGFESVYGPLNDYDILALTPSPEDNPDSSLIFMIDEWIRNSHSGISGFYLDDFPKLAEILGGKNPRSRRKLLIGLSYSLMDFANSYPCSAGDLIVMETGGMKGKRKELIREELHTVLKQNLGVSVIHSEYGMTELLSQAYSGGEGKFFCPPWMKVMTRDPYDPFQSFPDGKTGCLNIIDLANLYSCCFIATEDLGKTHPDGSFEVLGRFISGMERGCNLMVD